MAKYLIRNHHNVYGDFFMDIMNVINIINETYESYYEKNRDYRSFPSAIKTFSSGYCFEYFILLKRFFPNAILMMQNDKMHCAALIDGDIYDVNGIRYDTFNFHVATGCDYEYIYKMFAMFDFSFKDKFNKVVVKNVLNNQNKFIKTLNK